MTTDRNAETSRSGAKSYDWLPTLPLSRATWRAPAACNSALLRGAGDRTADDGRSATPGASPPPIGAGSVRTPSGRVLFAVHVGQRPSQGGPAAQALPPLAATLERHPEPASRRPRGRPPTERPYVRRKPLTVMLASSEMEAFCVRCAIDD